MRVLHVDTGREMRGGQWQALHLMRGLAGRGIENRLLAREGTLLVAEARMLGLDAEAISPGRLRRWSRWSTLVHAHDAKAHTAAALWACAPAVVSRRVAFPVQRGVFSRWKYRRAALFLAVSHAVARELEQAGVPAAKIRVVHDAAPVPAQPGRRCGGVVALESSDPLKGAAAIRASGLDVEFASNLPAALLRAKVFLYVSESEGLGSAALAALAHGVPVVASRVGGLPEVVRHEETGLLLETNDPASIRQAVLRLLADDALAARLGEAGRRMVESEFSVARMVERTIEAYSEVTRS